MIHAPLVSNRKGTLLIAQNFLGIPSPVITEEAIAAPRPDAVFSAAQDHQYRRFTFVAFSKQNHEICESRPAFNDRGFVKTQRAENAYDRNRMYGLNYRRQGSLHTVKSLVNPGRFEHTLRPRGRHDPGQRHHRDDLRQDLFPETCRGVATVGTGTHFE